MPVLGQEDDRQQIEKTFDEPAPTVFGLAPGPGMVTDRDLANPETLSMGQDRSKAVQLTVEAQRVGHLSPVRLVATVEVVERDTRGQADGAVEDLARQGLAERVLAALLPAGYQIAPLIQFGEESGQLIWIILKVAVHRDDDIALDHRKTIGERLGLAEAAAMTQRSDSGISGA